MLYLLPRFLPSSATLHWSVRGGEETKPSICSRRASAGRFPEVSQVIPLPVRVYEVSLNTAF